MKLNIRKCTKATVFYQSEIAEIDTDDFKNHEDNPFEGETEEEFLEYLKNFDFDSTYGLSEESIEEIRKIFEPTLEEYYTTTSDWEESWMESGEIEPTARKTGGFIPNCSTD